MGVWRECTDDTRYGVAVYNFPADSPNLLPLNVGDTVELIEECTDWYRGFSTKNRKQLGIFPKTFIHILECNSHVVKNAEDKNVVVVVPKEDVVSQEAAAVIREWGVIAREMFMHQKFEEYHALEDSMKNVILWRRQILSGTLPNDQLLAKRLQITAAIDKQNRTLGADVIPRDKTDGSLISLQANPLIKLYTAHQEIIQAQQAAKAKPRTESESSSHMVHHVLLEVKNIECAVFEEAEVLFTLYTADGARFFNEEFMVKLHHKGTRYDSDKPLKMQTVFQDLSTSDLSKDLHLVCRVFSVGKMEPKEEDKNRVNQNFRRPWGVGVLKLEFSKELGLEVVEDQLHLFTCSESDFSQLHWNLIRGKGDYKKLTKAKVVVKAKMLHGDEQDAIDPEVHRTRKMGFPEIVYPGNLRNDFYVTIGTGDLSMCPKRNPNIECVMAVVLDSGEVLSDCIVLPNDRTVNEYCSTIYYHTNKPNWHETVRLQIPYDKSTRQPHLRFVFRHMSSSETRDKAGVSHSFAFLRLLADDGTVITNTRHDLPVFKFSPKLDDPTIYLRDMGTMGGSTALQRNAKESFWVQTMLCSTKLTQNATLLALLKWRGNKVEAKIKETLKKMLDVEPSEIVKFLQDIFDALFSILDYDTEKYKSNVFEVLVYIIDIPTNRLYHHFRAVLDMYIQKHFSGAMAFTPLLSCVTSALMTVSNPNVEIEKIKTTTTVMCALEYIFKFVVQSRLLYTKGVGGNKGNEDFKREVLVTLQCFYGLLSKSEPKTLLEVQIAALQNFYSIFEELYKIFLDVELVDVAMQLVDAIHPDIQSNPLVEKKLRFLEQLVNGFLYTGEARAKLLPFLLRHLRTHLRKGPSLPLDLKVLMDILKLVPTSGNISAELQHLAENILRPLLRLCRQTKDKAGMGIQNNDALDLVVVTYQLLHLMPTQEFGRIISTLPEADLVMFIREVLDVVKSSVLAPVFANEWLYLLMERHKINVKALLQVTPAMKRLSQFDKTLWQHFFDVCVLFIQQPNLRLENFPTRKQRFLLEAFGDMRVQVATHMSAMWLSLKDNKISFVPGATDDFDVPEDQKKFLESILQVSLVPKSSLRRIILGMFFDILLVEFKSKGSFSKCKEQAIDKLDNYFCRRDVGDEAFKEQFREVLLPKFQAVSGLQEEGALFVETITKLLKLLLEMRMLGESEQRSDERAAVMLKLTRFFKDIGREEMYVKYVHNLKQLHLLNRSQTEAAFALQLYAKNLGWNDEKLSSMKIQFTINSITKDVFHKEETQRERKAALYLEIIDYLDAGKAWEQAIELCKELSNQYERELIDYRTLQRLLQRQAGFFGSIVSNPRGFSTYFRVGYYGQGFPLSIRNKEFIYRGEELESISTFVDRVQSQYPSAMRLNSNKPPENDIRNGPGMHLQIVKVDPVSKIPEWLKGKVVEESIDKYYQVNDVAVFSFSRPFKNKTGREIDYEDPSWSKDFTKSVQEFKDLWLDRVELCTEDSLPGILRRSEVIESHRSEISPIENAVSAIADKNNDLESWIRKYSRRPDPPPYSQDFTRAFNGVIDAAVNGGTKVYEVVFLDPRYLQVNPEHAPLIDAFKKSLNRQLDLLEQGVKLHEQACPQEMRGLHEHMVDAFKKMKKSNPDAPSTPVPALNNAPNTATLQQHHHQQQQPHAGSSTVATIAEADDDLDPADRALAIKDKEEYEKGYRKSVHLGKLALESARTMNASASPMPASPLPLNGGGGGGGNVPPPPQPVVGKIGRSASLLETSVRSENHIANGAATPPIRPPQRPAVPLSSSPMPSSPAISTPASSVATLPVLEPAVTDGPPDLEEEEEGTEDHVGPIEPSIPAVPARPNRPKSVLKFQSSLPATQATGEANIPEDDEPPPPPPERTRSYSITSQSIGSPDTPIPVPAPRVRAEARPSPSQRSSDVFPGETSSPSLPPRMASVGTPPVRHLARQQQTELPDTEQRHDDDAPPPPVPRRMSSRISASVYGEMDVHHDNDFDRNSRAAAPRTPSQTSLGGQTSGGSPAPTTPTSAAPSRGSIQRTATISGTNLKPPKPAPLPRSRPVGAPLTPTSSFAPPSSGASDT